MTMAHQGEGIQQKQEGVQDRRPSPVLPGDLPPTPKPLRLWPGVVLAALVSALIVGMPWLTDSLFVRFMAMFMGPMALALLVVLWWVFASRAAWGDKLLFPAVFLLAGAAGFLLSAESFRMGVLMYGLWAAAAAWPAWLLVSPGFSMPARRLGFAVLIAAVFGFCTLLRMDGVDGNFSAEIAWRFSATAEDRYLAELAKREKAEVAGAAVGKSGDWTGFRGEKRDGIARGVRIGNTDWKERQPRLVWSQRVGPGWSSFAVVGDRLYTQEQQDKAEAVVCYQASTGKTVWTHKDEERFYEPVAGTGPRATPTFHAGRLYALTAKGTLSCLDAATGKRHWKADLREDTGAKLPEWGFASSPCVAHGLVTVYGGAKDKAVAAYDLKTGKLAWAKGSGGHGYSSVQPAMLAGKEVLLAASGPGLIGLDPKTGDTVLDYEWPMQEGMARCTQSPVVDGTDLLFGAGFGLGTRRVRFKEKDGKLAGSEVWETKAASPYFNDMVLHKGHAYGFDGEFLTCFSLEDGEKAWKVRGYGNGQVLLLPGQDLLVVVGEKSGEAALVEATPEKHVSRGKFKWTKAKTWNHPVVADGKLYLRNGEDMACYDVGR
ncbi:MAG: PQQ-like beta-propeller repeat protein [Gemmataceae bacterium]|nr:PQQ-like beta-propeller repeat protein [Gemmataceae bacterium]